MFSKAETVVFDTRCQVEFRPRQVVLWGVRSGKFDIHEKTLPERSFIRFGILRSEMTR